MILNLNTNILILGSDGFIGRELLKGLSAHCYGISGRDVHDKSKLMIKLGKKPDVIINCCGSFTNDIEYDFNANVSLSAKLFEAIKSVEVFGEDFSPIIYLIGSAAEYGATDGKIKETHQCRPKSVYGISKYLQYQLAELYRDRGYKINYLRVFNLYGKGMSEKLLIGRLYGLIKENKALNFGNLGQQRDYMHVSVFVNILDRLIGKSAVNITVNIGLGKAILVRNLVKEILRSEGVKNYQLNENLKIDNKSNGVLVADTSYLQTKIGEL